VGAVLVGTSIDSLLPAMKHEALADVTFYGFDGSVLASTFSRADGDVDLAPRVAVNEGRVAGLREVKSIFGRDFDLLYGELRIRDETVGLFSVALPSSFISSAGTTTRWGMTVIFAIATVATIGTGLLIARGVTAPLLKLVRAAHAVTEGDLTARSGVSSRDEVGELATSFDVMTERLAKQHISTIRALTSAIDARDPYTAGHSVRVGQLSMEIGRELSCRSATCVLEVGGYLHDIGKIGIRDNVLLKPGRLTEKERSLIEEHPRIGINIVQYVDLADEVKQLVLSHHEKLDGTGYPEGLQGEQISIFARIGAVADIYDALTTERPYKPGLAVEEAVALLKREAKGGRLDERVVIALISALPLWGRRLHTDSTLKGFVLPELQAMETDLRKATA
jgi:putative nucleotidyltransferase with HDIG domain